MENGQDPADRLAAAQALAARHGWTVIDRAFDTTGATDPPTRPQLARLLSEVHNGKIHAIVSASRTDVSVFDDQYQRVLDQLRDRGGGLALARDETSL
ncbi:recombinase family protein [Streptomyces niveus]|uniref:recombinase family protein n=1 Tax=Streptomyces niveus TaxID=193462 RepID=UPI00366A4D22